MSLTSAFSKTFLRTAVTGLLLLSCAVFAIDLDSAKSRGLVGETDTGYLAALQPSPEVSALLEEINSKRKAEYQRIATRNGIALADVEKLAAKKAIEKTPSGQYVMVNGNWIRK